MQTDSPNRDPLIGEVLDERYRVDAFIARGGMGKVFRAHQLGLRRDVAVKVLDVRGPRKDQDVFRKRFFTEAAACARLSHPNTLRVFDHGTTSNDKPYIVMEYLQGPTLAELFDQGVMDPERLVDLMRQACSSLAEAHEAGLVHRDLKPSNIFVVPRTDGTEQVKVVDFGLVRDMSANRMTQSGDLLGSPLYMAPEQIRGDDVDPRADIYALGILVFQGIAGRLPFASTNVTAVLLAHVNGAVPSLIETLRERGLPPSLDWVVKTCMGKEPEDRFATTLELSKALAACLAEIQGVTGPIDLSLVNGRVALPGDVIRGIPAPGNHAADARKTTRRNVGLFMLASAAVLAVGAMAGTLWVQDTEALRPMLGMSTTLPTESVDVTVAVHPPEATIHRGSDLIGSGTALVEIPPGESVALRITAPGHIARRVVVDGSVGEIALALEAEEPTDDAPSGRKARPR